MKKSISKYFISKVFIASLIFCSAFATASNKEEKLFIEDMIKQHGFEEAELSQILSQVEVKDSILRAIARPAEKRLNWSQYRKIFMIPKRINGGVKFWQENKTALDRAYEKYGVPPEIITAIIGVETLYGANTGGYRVLDALATLGFHYPPRAKFFRSELSHFLRLTREENIDPLMPTGSYAGAMGKPQFIPSSFRAYSIDFDSDNKRDIWNNNVDIIGSVANYFKRHGWLKDQAVTRKVEGVTSKHQSFIDAGMKPSLSIADLRQANIKIDSEIDSSQKASLIDLELNDGNEYWAGLKNFYVITRYNHSNMYAMAVFQLSQAIKNNYQATATATATVK